MDARAAKLALARKKLKDHQDKKVVVKESSTEHHEDKSDTKDLQASEIAMLTDLDFKSGQNIEEQIVSHLDQNLNHNNSQSASPEVNLTEVLVTSKRNLELKINELQLKLSELESDYSTTVNNYNLSRLQINNLENNLKNLNDKYTIAADEVLSKERVIENLYAVKASLSDDNSNLQDQLEFTKTVLTAKETENDSLHSQLYKLQNQLDATQLHLQQITNGSADCITSSSEPPDGQKTIALQQKILNLEQHLKVLQKERDQISSHYEHYVSELNSQLKSVIVRNEELSREVQSLTNREMSLIDQIGDMEIRLQNYHTFKETIETKARINVDTNELQENYARSMELLTKLNNEYEELQKQFLDSEAKVRELSNIREFECNHDEISITKLTADITSDKVAVQRATEQNKKLKTSVQELEEAFIKLLLEQYRIICVTNKITSEDYKNIKKQSQDKLELVEKLTAEKYLNRELTIKLAEIEEKAKNMHTKLMAKDEEMIRLQTNCRETEKQLEQLTEGLSVSRGNEAKTIPIEHISQSNKVYYNNNDDVPVAKKPDKEIEKAELASQGTLSETSNDPTIPKEHAMLKLQVRFLKIMEEVADLSDEKHRLEHIILQLQNETDTICEYVALYQQQRSLLKKRDEERSAQIKIFQTECDCLRKQLEELGEILLRFAGDSKLSSYFQDEAKQADMAKVMDLLANLKHNSLIDPKKISLDLNHFFPCSCCSGQLIDV